MWSASLPVDVCEECDNYPKGHLVLVEARPWNGRRLTLEEDLACLDAALDGGPQAAFEWLSEHAH
jgi:hypothetical protein